MNKQKALFITIEGIEGVGKSTAIKIINDYCNSLGAETIMTREPGGTNTAEQIRSVLLAEHQDDMLGLTELLLMFAARVQNIAHIVKPALEQGKWVISDRFTDASFAYQGAGRQVGMQQVQTLKHMVQGDLKVDLTFLLDAPIEVAMARLADRSFDRIEKSGYEFFTRAREGYLELAAAEPDRFVVIDASQPIEQVNTAIIAACQERIHSLV